jgi:hypothetical protein
MSLGKYFSGDEDFTAEENLFNFIDMAKNELKVFGSDLKFDLNIWDITNTNPGKQNTNNNIIFSNLEDSKNTKKKKTDGIIPMREPFLSFSKAYLRYKQGLSPVKSFTPLIAAMRLLEYALIDMTQTANPTNITTDVLNRAIAIGKENFTDSVLYRHGNFLEKLAKDISEKKISKIPIDWKNPVKRPTDSQRVGKKADDRRNEKMPSAAALDALPEIFLKAKDPKDILISSMVAILLSSPDRIGELLLLQEYCEVIQKDSKGKESYGLAWYPEKGAKPNIKWVIPSMVDTVKKAIRRIRKLTQEARDVAKWYEDNPNKLYLPKHLEYLRKYKVLTTEDTALIFYGKDSKFMTTMYKNYNIPYHVEKKKAIVRFKDFERGIIRALPEDFPYINKEKKFMNTIIRNQLYYL